MRVSRRLVERSLADRNHLDELLLGVNPDDTQRFVKEEAHFGTRFRDCWWRIDQEPPAFLAQGDAISYHLCRTRC